MKHTSFIIFAFFLLLFGILLFFTLQEKSVSKISLSPTPTTSSLPTDVIEVKKDMPVIIPTTSLSITLTSASIPKPDCRDCLLSLTLLVKNNTKQQEITFQSGGFTGKLPKVQTAFGYTFDLYQATSDQILIKYAKQ